MVIATRPGEDILDSNMKHICFAVNFEGINNSGFAGHISRHFWPELANVGQCELGTSLTMECDGVFFHALVCNSMKNGWGNSSAIVRKCFNSIETDDPLASIAIGTSIDGRLAGARFSDIFEGMENSKKQIILF